MLLEEMIRRCIAAKEGDRAFILTIEQWSDGTTGDWFAAIGNKSKHVGIGEIIGYDDGVDFEAEGKTPMEAVEALYAKLTAVPAHS